MSPPRQKLNALYRGLLLHELKIPARFIVWMLLQEAVDRVGQILSGDGLPNPNLPQPLDPRRQLAEDLPPVLEGEDPNFNPTATAVNAEPIAGDLFLQGSLPTGGK
jgi:hypothetical protein